MAVVNYSYFKYDGLPCRIEAGKGEDGRAEIYEPGVGFVEGPRMGIILKGRIISKAEHDALLFKIVREGRAEA